MIYNAILFTTTERTLPIKNVEKFNKPIKLSLPLSGLVKIIQLPLNIGRYASYQQHSWL
jgi:hypothetical protein